MSEEAQTIAAAVARHEAPTPVNRDGQRRSVRWELRRSRSIVASASKAPAARRHPGHAEACSATARGSSSRAPRVSQASKDVGGGRSSHRRDRARPLHVRRDRSHRRLRRDPHAPHEPHPRASQSRSRAEPSRPTIDADIAPIETLDRRRDHAPARAGRAQRSADDHRLVQRRGRASARGPTRSATSDPSESCTHPTAQPGRRPFGMSQLVDALAPASSASDASRAAAGRSPSVSSNANPCRRRPCSSRKAARITSAARAGRSVGEARRGCVAGMCSVMRSGGGLGQCTDPHLAAGSPRARSGRTP